mgnify:CR=1 FL=1
MNIDQNQDAVDHLSDADINKIASLIQIFINIDRRINGNKKCALDKFAFEEEEN